MFVQPALHAAHSLANQLSHMETTIPFIDTALPLLQSYWLPSLAVCLITTCVLLFILRDKSGNPSRGSVIKCHLIRVIDGDSVIVKLNRWRGERNVRLWGIDAPEVSQSMGRQCTEHLRRLLHRRRLSVTIKATDRYDRLVCELHDSRKRESINTLMVKDGYAYAFTRYGGPKDIQYAQEAARSNRLGIWQNKKNDEERPWEYRSRRRAATTQSGNKMAVIVVSLIIVLVVAAALTAFILTQ